MRLLKKTVLAGAAVIAALAVMPTQAHAATIYYLDCEITGSNTCGGTTTVGTITLDDTGAGIQFTINITDPATKIGELDFNTGLTDGAWTTTGGAAGLVTAPGNPDGYGANFDFEIAFDTSGSSNLPQTFTLLNSLHNLTIADVAQLDALNQLFFAVHLQGFANNCSEWIGSDGTTNPARTGPVPSCGGTSGGGGSTGGGGATVPEPASMLLFGASALATAYRARRRATR
jgi:PEP-CTERM putative exosortase interaction domain